MFEFSNNFIIGIILVLFGLSIVLKEILGISIPLLRLALAVFLIYWGISLITDLRNNKNAQENTVLFEERTIIASAAGSYQTIFGSSTIDLTQLPLDTKPTRIKVSTVFGKITVYIDPNIPTHISSNSVLAHISFPDASAYAQGKRDYMTTATTADIILDVQAVFGSIDILEK